MSEQGGAPPQRPGRYQRSFQGLVGAMVITLVAIVGFVAFRAVTRDNPEVEPEPVDYLGLVADQQEAGRTPIYPRTLPEGWIASSISYTPGDRPGWGIGMHTDEGTYAGVRQQEEDLVDLLDTYVDEETTPARPISVAGSVATDWEAFTDDGGDHAFAAEVGDEVVLVYGSASVEDLRTLVGLLTTAPVR